METAGTSNIVVIRQRDGKYEGQALDLDAALAGKAPLPFILQPRDIVFVPQSTIVKVDQWIDQYINNSHSRCRLYYSQDIGVGPDDLGL